MVCVVYMNGFQCNMQGATSTTPLPPAQVARRYVALFVILTRAYRLFILAAVVTTRTLAAPPTLPIAHTVRSSLCTGTRPSATTCSRGHTPRRSTTTCTTSSTASKPISSNLAIRPLSPMPPPPPRRLCPRLPRLHPLRRRRRQPRLPVLAAAAVAPRKPRPRP